ncbi:uncharacterized protein PF11_0207-like [Sceloporus undulatus]|uniref:uncharacterized protein PF11_0207-like n=1 Tax=Sceloporus undulatus TaxID=8520 RepID=UPI001C4AB38D|nr:uncharacterized protein PF11_0207-like [Sceloporus undulatus]
METRSLKKKVEKERKTEKMAMVKKGYTQTQTLIQRRGSGSIGDDTMKIVDPIAALVDEIKSLRQELRENRQEMKEDLKESIRDIREEIKEARLEIRKDFKKEIDNMGKRMDKFSSELNKNQKEIEKLKDKNNMIEKMTMEISKKQETQQSLDWTNELRYRDRCIKIRGLKESQGENLEKRIIKPLADFIKIEEEIMNLEIDKLFRVNSQQAKDKKLPRDVVICFVRTKFKELIIQESYANKLIVEDTEIKIFKDIHPQIMIERQKYKSLVLTLNKMEINYKWDRIEGLSFLYKQKRYKIDNIDIANELEEKLKNETKNMNEEKNSFKEWKNSSYRQERKEKREERILMKTKETKENTGEDEQLIELETEDTGDQE